MKNTKKNIYINIPIGRQETKYVIRFIKWIPTYYLTKNCVKIRFLNALTINNILEK